MFNMHAKPSDVTWAAALALGWQAAAHWLVFTNLQAPNELVDANVMFRLLSPLVMQAQSVAVILAAVVGVLAYRSQQKRAIVGLCGVLWGITTLDRLFLLPQWHETWLHCDLTLGRPIERLRVGEIAAAIHQAVVLVLVAGWSWLLARQVLLRADRSPAAS